MKRLSDHIPRLTNGVVPQSNELSVTNPKRNGRAERVWFRLGEIYSNKVWIDHHGETPSPGWVARIEQLSDQQIKRGLEALSVAEEQFYPVPNMVDFTRYCTMGAKSEEKFCPWPIFDGVPVGIPNMTLVQRARYERADYDNVALHREWIFNQPYGRKDAPEQSVLEVLGAGDYTVGDAA